MPTYYVTLGRTEYKVVRVTADDDEAAMEAAEEDEGETLDDWQAWARGDAVSIEQVKD